MFHATLYQNNRYLIPQKQDKWHLLDNNIQQNSIDKIVLLNIPEQDFMEHKLTILFKIFNAKNWQRENVVIINLMKSSIYKDIKQYMSPNIIDDKLIVTLIFGMTPQYIGVHCKNIIHQCLNTHNSTIIYTKSLYELEKNTTYKLELWKALNHLN